MTVITSILMMPPVNAGSATTVVNGRSYTCAAGSEISVPWFDADVLEANRWIKSAHGGSGATAGRPTTRPDGMPIPRGYQFLDTTLGVTIVYSTGGVWRDPSSGAAV